MKSIFALLKWQFILLQKNNIIGISIAITLLYALVLYFFRDISSLNNLLIILIINDPAMIGFFFVGLAFYTEIKHNLLSAFSVSPLSVHHIIISRLLVLSILGTLCSLGLTVFVLKLDFNIWLFTFGAFSICLLSSLIGLVIFTHATEFLKFTILSIPFFLILINVPLLDFLEVIDLGFLDYIFPIAGGLKLIDFAINGSETNFWTSILSIFFFTALLYQYAYLRFRKTLAL